MCCLTRKWSKLKFKNWIISTWLRSNKFILTCLSLLVSQEFTFEFFILWKQMKISRKNFVTFFKFYETLLWWESLSITSTLSKLSMRCSLWDNIHRLKDTNIDAINSDLRLKRLVCCFQLINFDGENLKNSWRCCKTMQLILYQQKSLRILVLKNTERFWFFTPTFQLHQTRWSHV